MAKDSPWSLRQRILSLGHESPMAGHPGDRRMYISIRQHHYWPYLATDLQMYVSAYQKCLERVTLYTSHHDMNLSLARVRRPAHT